MRLADLSPEALDKIKKYGLDELHDKHEHFGWHWRIDGDRVDFMTIDGRDVLLPVYRDELPTVRVLRAVVGEDQESLTIFFSRTIEDEDYGYVAFCQKVPGEDFFLALLYHSLYFVENFARPTMGERPR